MFSKYVSAGVLAVSLMTVAATSASAGSYDLGTLTSSYAYTDVINNKSSDRKFADIFTRPIADNFASDTKVAAKSQSFHESVYEARKPSLTNAAAGTAAADGPNSDSDFFNRDYSIDASGNTQGWAGGLYSGNFIATLSPTPETTTIAMLLAGLGLVVTTARRRTAHR